MRLLRIILKCALGSVPQMVLHAEGFEKIAGGHTYPAPSSLLRSKLKIMSKLNLQTDTNFRNASKMSNGWIVSPLRLTSELANGSITSIPGTNGILPESCSTCLSVPRKILLVVETPAARTIQIGMTDRLMKRTMMTTVKEVLSGSVPLISLVRPLRTVGLFQLGRMLRGKVGKTGVAGMVEGGAHGPGLL